jgi:hypothetical protein
LYPLIELLERVALRFEREESPEQKLRKLEGFLVRYGLPLAEAVPLFAAYRAIGVGVAWPWWLALLAEACSKVGQLDERLCALEEALAAVQHNEEGHYEAEVYRLKGSCCCRRRQPTGRRGRRVFSRPLTSPVARRQSR